MGDPDAPILQPWAKAQVSARNDAIRAGKPGFTRQASCWPNGTPAFLLYPQQPLFFVQTPKMVVLIWQGDHQVRHIYLGGQHSKNPKPSWYGESVGHYEGDTLVVDTIGISEKSLVDNFGTPHSPQLHTVERYRIAEDRMRLEVNLHVEDPAPSLRRGTRSNATGASNPAWPNARNDRTIFSPRLAMPPPCSSRAAQRIRTACSMLPEDVWPIPQERTNHGASRRRLFLQQISTVFR
jgi:hypothetical protein